MKIKKMTLILLFLLLTVLSCSDPDITISVPNQSAPVFGIIHPVTNKAIVKLIKLNDTIAETQTNGIDGSFEFKDIPYGVYTIVACTDSLYSIDNIQLYNNLTKENLYMAQGNQFISKLSNDTGALSVGRIGSDTVVNICIQVARNVILPEKPVHLTPEHLNDDFILLPERSADENYSYCIVRLNADSLFLNNSQNKLQMKLEYKTSSTSKSDSLSFEWEVDCTGYMEKSTKRLINHFYPNDSWTKDSVIIRIDIESNIEISFTYPMNRLSVENSLHFSPSINFSCFWDETTLNIVPANVLKPDQRFAITIDTTAKTADGRSFKVPYTINYKTYQTDFFESSWPVNSSTEIPLQLPLSIKSFYGIDPVLLKNAFHCNPPIDSLQFISKYENSISIYHSLLQPSTTYTVSIDSTLTSCKGTRSGTTYTFSFTTAAK